MGRATNNYTYIEPELPPPNIYFLSPDQGTELGGTPVEIHGINFDKDASVYLVHDRSRLSTRTSLDPNAQILQVIAPVGQAGQSVSVQVQNDDGQSDIAPFSYNAEEPPLTLSNLIPPQGPNDESNTVSAGRAKL